MIKAYTWHIYILSSTKNQAEGRFNGKGKSKKVKGKSFELQVERFEFWTDRGKEF